MMTEGKQRERNRVVLSLLAAVVMGGYYLLVTVSQDRSARQLIREVPDMGAYREAIGLGLSEPGARAWSRYSDWAEHLEENERSLVASGDQERLSFVRLSLEDYLVRHPEYQCSHEEDACMDPHLRQALNPPVGEGGDGSR